jgi:hypothetical protein
MSESKFKVLSKEKLLSYRESHYLTVGRLLEFIKENNIPEDAIVVSQRVEDIYFETHSWGVYQKEGEHTHWMRNMNGKIDSGVFDDKEKFPMITEEMKKKFTEDDINEAMDQYHPVWSPVLHKDDKDDILFLDLHY